MNKRRRKTRLLLAAFIIVLLATCGIYYKAYVQTDVYQDQEEFTAFADSEFASRQLLKTTGSSKTEYNFESPISYAMDYDIYENEEITAFRDQQMERMKTVFSETKTAEEAEREKKYGDRIGYKPLSHALLISSCIYESNNGVISIVIYEGSSTEKEKAMHREYADIHTYQFSAKTGEQLRSVQIFDEDYRQVCAEYFTEYFSSNYSSEDLTKEWESYLTSAETNYNEFAVTESGVIFFFDEGTILKKSKGPAYAGITAEQMGKGVRKEVIERYIDPSKPMVAITYDDGPGGKSETKILDCLEKNNAVATFFYQGYRISGNEDKIKRAYLIGCEIGNHTWDHPVLTELSKNKVKKQIVNTNQAVYKACGAYPTVFRPSYGITNEKINKISGMPVIMWTVDTQDWKSRNAKKVFKYIKNQKDLDGKIILLHSIHGSTAEATELLVPWLKEQGYQLVTVSELIKYGRKETPKDGKIYR